MSRHDDRTGSKVFVLESHDGHGENQRVRGVFTSVPACRSAVEAWWIVTEGTIEFVAGAFHCSFVARNKSTAREAYFDLEEHVLDDIEGL